jgi:hypothetical protein
VDPRADLDDMEKILDPTGTQTPTPRSLYLLHYPGSEEERFKTKLRQNSGAVAKSLSDSCSPHPHTHTDDLIDLVLGLG